MLPWAEGPGGEEQACRGRECSTSATGPKGSKRKSATRDKGHVAENDASLKTKGQKSLETVMKPKESMLKLRAEAQRGQARPFRVHVQ